jgi:hypothetical protein
MLARHAGASRFAYNQCLRPVADALASKRTDPQVRVPWSGFDLINACNTWKRSEAAGRVFVAAADSTITKQVTGLAWRHEVSSQLVKTHDRLCLEDLAADRDRNAAANLAAWAERYHAQAPDRQAGGRATNAPGGEGAGHRPGDGETDPSEGGTDAHALVV